MYDLRSHYSFTTSNILTYRPFLKYAYSAVHGISSVTCDYTLELWLKRWGTESNIIIQTQQTAAYCIVQQTGMIPLKLNRESIRLQERERVRAERDVELLLFSMISTAAVFFQWGMGSRCHKQLNQTLQFLQAEKKQRQYAFKYPGFASILCSAFRVFVSLTNRCEYISPKQRPVQTNWPFLERLEQE